MKSVKLKILIFSSIMLTLLLVREVLGITKFCIQTSCNEFCNKEVSIFFVNKNNQLTTLNRVVRLGNDTFEILFDEISYCAISNSELSMFKLPVFDDDTLFISIDFIKNDIICQSKKYQQVYACLDTLNKRLRIIEVEIYRKYTDLKFKDSLISTLDFFIKAALGSINKNSTLQEKNVFFYYTIELLKLKANLYLLLFSQNLIKPRELPNIEVFIPKKVFLLDYEPFIDFKSFISKVINLAYLKYRNKSVKKLFFAVQKLFKKTLLNKQYYFIAETELINFIADFLNDKSTLYFLEKKVKKNLNEFSNSYPNLTNDLVRLHSTLTSRIKLTRGSYVPDITLLDLDSNYFSLKTLKGKPIILVFWATWCSGCQEDINSLLVNKEQLFLDTFHLVFIALEKNNFKTWKEYVLHKKIPGIHLYAEDGFSNKEIRKFAVTFVPFHIILHSDFKVFHYNAPPFSNVKYYLNIQRKF